MPEAASTRFLTRAGSRSYFRVTDPDGKHHYPNNLTYLCTKYDLDARLLLQTSSGKEKTKKRSKLKLSWSCHSITPRQKAVVGFRLSEATSIAHLLLGYVEDIAVHPDVDFCP